MSGLESKVKLAIFALLADASTLFSGRHSLIGRHIRGCEGSLATLRKNQRIDAAKALSYSQHQWLKHWKELPAALRLLRDAGGCRNGSSRKRLAFRVVGSAGSSGAADARLTKVQQGLALRDPISAGLLSLDRSQALLGWGRWSEATEHGIEAQRFFTSLRISVEAAAARRRLGA